MDSELGSAEIRNYVENPDILLALCQAVLNELIGSTNDTELREKQAQLVEVTRSIDQLTKLSIGIPDELRNLKINLVTEVEAQTINREKLDKLWIGLKEIINTVDSTYLTSPSKKKRKRRRKSNSNLPHTKKEVLRDEIIDALRILGGSGTNREVVDIIEEHMRDKLLPGDFEKRARGTLVWINNVHWERNTMKEEGILRSDSPRGIWELSEEYK